MPDKLNKNASVWLLAPALFFLCGLSTEANPQPFLQSEKASLAAPQTAGGAAPVLPPLAPSRDSPANPSYTKSAGRDRHIFEFLDKMTMPGWSAQQMSLHQTAPRQSTGATKIPQSTPAIASDSGSTSGSEPSILDLASEFGCTTLAQRTFTQVDSEIVASVYQFGTSEGAYGAYCCLRKGASNLIPKGDASSEDDKDISFWKDKYFVNISASSSDGAITMTRIAEQLAASIPASSAKPAILTQLPTLEKVLGSEKIVMGPLALKRLYPAPYVTALVADTDGVHGAIADYQMQEPYRERLKLLVLRFASPAVASLSFSKYVGQLGEQHDEQDLEGFTYQTSIFKVGGTFMLCQIRNDELVIITGSRKKLSLATLAKEIY
ncbi:MAG: hypothetical protein C5B53_13475 [Candidatus Melainabacteria bacterium]|nr:MAG: hypothetical protein C5B53_13475 [Candidatus Melainabacteria bacterium]